VPLYYLEHVRINHEYEDDTDVKTCGIFSSSENAQSAIQKLIQQPGFRDYQNGFRIYTLTLDEVYWTEGFIRSSEIQCADDEEDEGDCTDQSDASRD